MMKTAGRWVVVGEGVGERVSGWMGECVGGWVRVWVCVRVSFRFFPAPPNRTGGRGPECESRSRKMADMINS